MTDFAPVRFSTATLPVPDRIPFWREVVGREIVHVEIEPLLDAPLESNVSLRALPGLRSFECVASPAQVRRTQAFLADGDDSFALLVNVSGAMTFSQRGREISLGAGEAVLIMHAEPSIMNHSQIHMVGLAIPSGALAPLVPNFENVAMRPVPPGNDALRLLAGYLRLMHEDLPLATPELRHQVATHMHDLIATAIGASGLAVTEERGVGAARLAAAKADVVARLDRRDISVATIAARQQVTSRYVQMLFEREGTTFSQFVLEQRLARAHQLLTSSRHAGWTVSAIALAAGFGDLSHFNRSFRRHYGATPSDVRCASQGSDRASSAPPTDDNEPC